MEKMTSKKGAALLALMAGAAILILPSPGRAGFEMKGYASAPAVQPLPPAPSAVPAAPSAAEVLPGFGSGLPLAIALQQVAPAGYQFSFGPGVDPGAPVSWTGGKPWQQVLADMLAAQNLGYRLQDNAIIIARAGAEIPPAPVAVPIPPAEPALAEAGMAPFEEEILDEEVKKPAPMVTRRNNRRGAVSTRRDFGTEGRRSLFARLADKFKSEKPKTETAATKPKEAPKAAAAPEAIQWGAAPAEAPPPAAAAAEKPAAVEAVALAPTPTPTSASAPEAIQWQDAVPEKPPFAESEVVSGFGTDMPLAIALQQVVPPGYDVSFAGGVNRNISVSWEGGKPWQQVLANMLAAQKLGFQVEGKTVAISPVADKAPASQEQWLPPVPLTREEIAATPALPAPQAVPEKPVTQEPPAQQAEEKPAAAPRDPIVSRRDSIAGRRAAESDNRSWLERFRDRFGFTKKEQGQEQAQTQPQTSAESAAPLPAETAEVKVPEEKPAVVSSRRSKPAKAQTAQEVAPPPQAVPLSATAKPAAESPAKPLWLAPKDKTLRDVLTDWSKKEGVELYWSTDYDYRLTGNAAYSGSYDEAVGKLLGDFSGIRPQPYGELHQALDGSRVLVINTYTTYN